MVAGRIHRALVGVDSGLVSSRLCGGVGARVEGARAALRGSDMEAGGRSNGSARSRLHRGHRANRYLIGLLSGLGENRSALRIDEHGTLHLHGNRACRRRTRKGAFHGLRLGAIQNTHVVELVGVYSDSCLLCGTTGGKILMAHGRDAGGAVDVGDVGDIGYVDDVHIGVLDVNAAALLHVGDVDPVNVAGTGVIPGAVALAGTEGEPC